MRTSKTGNSAFTVVELIVVIAILSILTGMTVMRLGGRSRSGRLREASRRLLTAAQYARDFTTTRRRACRLTFDPNGSYSLWYQSDPHNDPGKYSQITSGLARAEKLADPLKLSKIRVVSRSSTDPQATSASFITFHPTGLSDGAIIEITDGRRKFSLLIEPHTGRAKLVEGEVDELPNGRKDLDA